VFNRNLYVPLRREPRKLSPLIRRVALRSHQVVMSWVPEWCGACFSICPWASISFRQFCSS